MMNSIAKKYLVLAGIMLFIFTFGCNQKPASDGGYELHSSGLSVTNHEAV